ncbi:TonB-dependent siderophore receptor [Moraxella oblonga]|uniref:TonB-dependent siderophore receptor n=1 Tax=Moraxella oblonga TaxID=200413 RepID=UPI00082F4103|nr:TonB-dependent siderophore receptor [Moraxella oblonga]
MLKFTPSFLAFAIFANFAHANTTPQVQLDAMTIGISRDAGKYVAIKPNSLKDNTPLYYTAQSVSVFTPPQVEQKQANTVAELLENVAGVSSGVQGRRGWDDFIIRGQVSSNQMYVDGMRVQMSSNNLRAWDVAGADSIEVIKGTTTTGYGMALPSGIVNITSKRPDDETFAKGKISLGTFNTKEFSYDLNYAPNASKKGAFRLNGRFADRDDATDHVYFKDNYIAPSYTFDLGDKTNLTLLGSYQWREYIRQQGLPHNNTINQLTGEKTIRNAHQKYPPSTFFGLPQNVDKQNTLRLGYDLSHVINDNYTFKSIFAYTKTDTDGNPTLANNYANFYRDGLITRQVNTQDKNDTMLTMDNRIEAYFSTGNINHDVTVGLDLLREKSSYVITRANANERFDADEPKYDFSGTGRVTTTRDWLTHTQYAGLYAKDTMRFNDFIFGATLRHDWATTKQTDNLVSKTAKATDSAITGNVSAMYDYQGKFAPYVSFGTSFLQNTDVGADGNVLDPEKGQNAEIGIKFQGFDRRLQGYASVYDITRKNVAETVYDANGNSLNYSALVGKQRTKGFEFETAYVMNNQWNISGSYSYIPTAKILQSTTTTDIGQRISQIPKHSASVSTQYHFSPDRLGWYVGGGIRYQGDRTAWRGNSFIDLPAYTVLDAKAGYESKNWGVGLAVKNLTDKDYLVGTSPNSQLVSYGEPRNVRATLTFKY